MRYSSTIMVNLISRVPVLIVLLYIWCATTFAEGKPRSSSCLMEGDIKCPRKLRSPSNIKRRSRSGIVFATKRSYSNGPSDSSVLWPTRLIPYKIAAEFTSDQLAILRSAINDIESSSCVKFMPITGQQFTDYVSIIRDKGCYSDVGRIGGEQQISLDLNCFNRKTVYHELLHTLGFWHEHNRPDRDKYIKVIRENIDPARLQNFKITDEYVSELGPWDYDYYSVTHYKTNDYSRDGKSPTLLPIDPNIKAEDLGNSQGITKQDIEKINYFYRCEVKSCPVPVLNDHVIFISSDGNENNIGAKVTYSCDAFGYTLVGSTTQICLSNGHWSGQRPRCLPMVSHYCNFESNALCGWTTESADVDWEKSSGRSMYRFGTGPITDLTYGTLDGHFLRLDSQNIELGSRAIISTPKLPLPSQGVTFCLSFGYYMWGLVVGNLKVTLITDSGRSAQLFSVSGSQGPKWIETSTTFSPDTTFRIQFEATIGSEIGDIAIDDVTIEPCSRLSRMVARRRKSKARMRFYN